MYKMFEYNPVETNDFSLEILDEHLRLPIWLHKILGKNLIRIRAKYLSLDSPNFGRSIGNFINCREIF